MSENAGEMVNGAAEREGAGAGAMELKAVGVVHTEAKERRDVVCGGSTAVVEVFEPFWPALDQIEHNSHIVLFGWFHRSDRSVLKTRPRKVAPFAFERGVFASRSPDRPNPVAMTIVPLLEKRGHELIVRDLDFIDGTPLIDIKPYCPGWDSVFSAVHRRRANPALQTDAILREFYRRDLINHVGREAALSPTGELAVEACLLATRHLECDPRDADLCLVLHGIHPLMDGLMAITGASLTNGRLSVAPDPGEARPLRVEISRGGKVLRLESPDGREPWRVF